MQSIVELSQVGKCYWMRSEQAVALHDLSFSCAPGELVVLRCRSRLARVVIVNLLMGFEPPTTGSYCLFGKSIRDYTDDQLTELLYTKVGVIRKDPVLLSQKSLFENVMLPLNFAGQERADGPARALEALAEFHILDKKNHLPEWLTYRERLAAALARERCKRTQFLIFDGTMDGAAEKTREFLVSAAGSFTSSNCCVAFVTESNTLSLPGARTISIS